ncbi:MAG: zf-HC2 domain-containing protein [Gemmatimonadota bacterium]|nr:zf-HC2 domain-containing protein [Gemmatimonadota bacterium]MDH3477432.1 zf-HC2 domain-containing protein [Gemmatimonadota bacterium]MDH3569565.1 zf-HC2 domain-containing protein [Gemmatimonadota bacterium]MDH5549070.1 zf-HC2 domain-containing protein [Gemmatimonadota bacterium]
MKHQWTDRLSEYLDDELDAADRSAVEAHLRECEQCRSDLGQLEAVVARARELTDRLPAVDLWPAIVRRLGTAVEPVTDLTQRRARRRIAFSVPQLAAAGVALMLLSAGAVWLTVARNGPPVVAVDSAAPVAALTVSAELAAYDATIAELGAALRLDGDRLDTATVRVLEENLAIIDRAIAEARTALEQDPASRYLNGHLGRTLRRKVDLLQRAATLVTAAS